MRLPGMPPATATIVASLASFPLLASGFYLPGVAPTSYRHGVAVPLFVNSISPGAVSDDARLHSVISYDYYDPRFQFCQPIGGPKYVSESLGSILFGDRIMTSPFQLEMGQNKSCQALCTQTYATPALDFVWESIVKGYKLNWLVDGLPAGQMMEDAMDHSSFYSPGFYLGALDVSRSGAGDGLVMQEVAFNNHYDIFIEYHQVQHDARDEKKASRVVGVVVQPESRKYTAESGPAEGCGKERDTLVVTPGMPQTEVQFSYSVYWRESDTAWATRWDKYLHVFDPKIHWFWLIDTAIIVVILVMTVMSILVRTLKKDIARYNRLDQINLDDLNGTADLEDGVQEDSGWKLVHGDVFRTPSHTLLLSVLLGNGAQLFVMTGCTIVFALLGFLSPSNRGSLGTIILLLYTILGFVGGYVSSRVYKSFQGDKWKLNIGLTPILVPAVVFSGFFLLNLFLWAKGSSGAVPFTTMLVIVAIWFVISTPLSFAGSWLGLRAAAIDSPVRTNQIPRQIPPSCPNYLRPVPSMLLVGLLPFGAIFVELYFIMSSIWFSRIYYMFGFLFLCYGLMIITCAAVTILMVYFLLCAENYHWQWRSFMAAGMSGGYIFMNCLLYLVTKISLGGFASIVVYLGYSAVISLLFSILAGSIGYFASWWFVRKIYSSIKVD